MPIPGQSSSVCESVRAKGTRGHPLEVHATFFYPQNLLNANKPCRTLSEFGRRAILSLQFYTPVHSRPAYRENLYITAKLE